MGILKRSDLIKLYESQQSYLISESGEKKHSASVLSALAKSFTVDSKFDIFLSHAFEDARIVRQIRNMLTERGFSVYVDWIDDESLNRQSVSAHTARVIKSRMNTCASLVYLTSSSAQSSVWMPWELGYMDSQTGRVAIAPVLEDDEQDFVGREYLGLYPYVDLTLERFYIHRDASSWVTLADWMKGEKPSRRI